MDPTAKRLNPARLSSLQMPVERPDCHQCFWKTSYKSKIFMTPSSGSINLQLTELGKAVYLLYYWFINVLI